jgi:hypothetical protein
MQPMLNNLSKPMSSIIVGVNDYYHLTDSWHERSVDARSGVIYRTAASSATLQILKPPDRTQLKLLISGAPYLLGKPVLVKIKCAAHVLSYFSLTTENWVLRCADIDTLPAGLLTLTIETAPVYIPHKCLCNGDFRELGINLAAALIS